MGWVVLLHNLHFEAADQTGKFWKQESFKALLITSLPPFPSQMQATKKLIQEAEAQIVGFALYNSTNIIFYIIFS